ncbi:hypothetical protein SAY87_000724 [Trapa incisa]|uniref:Chlororespiratory reduction 4 n=1 Tax=Trapa incisa TaxID=236973 RepID=A0AAN7GF00_9MYRT|nr:hypothetical protein SAY87_000724 [Trapa incisa]
MLLCSSSCSSSSSCQPWSSPAPTLILLQSCRTLSDVAQLHSRLITTGFIRSPSITTNIILSFSSSPHPPLVQFARFLLVSRRSPSSWDDPFLWNAVIKSHSHGLDPRQALALFCLMLESGVFGDKFSFSLALKACSRVGDVRVGKQIHGLLSKTDIRSNLYLENGLIGFYLRCGDYSSAYRVFVRMPHMDSVTYNSMIDGCVKCGMVDSARALFDSMPPEKRNLITWNSILSVCSQSGGLEHAWELFGEMPERDLISWNTMIDACVKAGKVNEARVLFDVMPERDLISWASMIDGYAKACKIDIARSLFDKMPQRDVVACNTMMAGYVQNGLHEEALDIFHCMQNDILLSPDITTLSIALSVVAQLVCLDKGLAIHQYMEQKSFSINGKLGVSLIDMYSKCGSIEKAMLVFDSIRDKEVHHWNAMIGGMAIHGLGELAFNLFMEMERLSVEPDDITFIGVLNACSHSGLVKEGLIVFEIMRRFHKLYPRLQHYGCVVDILSRAGHLGEAFKFIEAMPIEPNEVIWRTLLSNSKIHENPEIGKVIAEHLIQLDSRSSSSYILLSNTYASLNLWGSVSRIRMEMKEKNIKKIPGCSWIELEGTLHEFFAYDESHPQVSDACTMLGRMLIPNPEVAFGTY